MRELHIKYLEIPVWLILLHYVSEYSNRFGLHFLEVGK